MSIQNNPKTTITTILCYNSNKDLKYRKNNNTVRIHQEVISQDKNKMVQVFSTIAQPRKKMMSSIWNLAMEETSINTNFWFLHCVIFLIAGVFLGCFQSITQNGIQVTL